MPNLGFPFNGAGLPKLEGVSWVENAYQLLTKPGQFYLDTAANYLYYMPRPGEDLATAEVELPVLDKLVDLSGTPGHLAPVNDTDPARDVLAVVADLRRAPVRRLRQRRALHHGQR